MGKNALGALSSTLDALSHSPRRGKPVSDIRFFFCRKQGLNFVNLTQACRFLTLPSLSLSEFAKDLGNVSEELQEPKAGKARPPRGLLSLD